MQYINDEKETKDQIELRMKTKKKNQTRATTEEEKVSFDPINLLF